jgi:hypothetical protein
MLDRTSGLLDPAALADEVRDLAIDTHRVLKARTPEGREIAELSRRIASLQGQIRGYSFDELACWLDSVRQIVEAA